MQQVGLLVRGWFSGVGFWGQLGRGVGGGLVPSPMGVLQLQTRWVCGLMACGGGGLSAPTGAASAKPLRLRRGALLRRLLVRFESRLLGQPVGLLLSRNLQARLSMAELTFLAMQGQRIYALMPSSLSSYPRRQNYVWRFGAIALYLAVALRDVTLLVEWLQSRIGRITLFQHRRFFRTLGVALRVAVGEPLLRYRLRGLRLQVTGKLSVTGNAMSRTYLIRAGKQGGGSLSVQLVQRFFIVRTRTGCLGVWLDFYF